LADFCHELDQTIDKKHFSPKPEKSKYELLACLKTKIQVQKHAPLAPSLNLHYITQVERFLSLP
jgi:hypothetical protein